MPKELQLVAMPFVPDRVTHGELLPISFLGMPFRFSVLPWTFPLSSDDPSMGNHILCLQAQSTQWSTLIRVTSHNGPRTFGCNSHLYCEWLLQYISVHQWKRKPPTRQERWYKWREGPTKQRNRDKRDGVQQWQMGGVNPPLFVRTRKDGNDFFKLSA
jgi:hypothetical protein